MAGKCAVCNKGIGGMLGVAPLAASDIAIIQQAGVDVPDTLCYTCGQLYLGKANNANAAKGKAADKIEIYTFNPFSVECFEYLGTVTGFTALGTGPISQLMANWSDFFGMESMTYNGKMNEATSACLAKLKYNAHTMGADTVIGVQTSFTELTAGNGQLMVAMLGTAIKLKTSREAD